MSTKERWWGWHKENPHVYQMFSSFTKTAIDAGLPHSSAWLIVNRIRWETAIETQGDTFKISNDFIAYYARLFMVYNPEHDGFFRTKKLKDEIV
jgi:hypothetical protein|tara:strand:- start:177 stop:458 length:282 start_codon:yes stop_codon:yes gene_type:complete